jgi:hypothetical protein
VLGYRHWGTQAAKRFSISPYFRNSMRQILAVLGVLALMVAPAFAQSGFVSAEIERRVNALLRRMTLDEKDRAPGAPTIASRSQKGRSARLEI